MKRDHDYIEINLSNIDELLDVKTNLRHAELPNKEFIDKFLSFASPFSFPYLPVRDITLYDTLMYLCEVGAILSGGYGINACFFEPDERRLSLADIDFINDLDSSLSTEALVSEANSIISDRGGVLKLYLGEKETVIGLLTLNVEKMRWLRRIGVNNVYSYKRSILYPPIGTFALRGQPLLEYLKKRNFSKSKEWPKFSRKIKELDLTAFRVETIEVDIVLESVNTITKEVRPLLELVNEGKFIKKTGKVQVIHPEDAASALYEAVKHFVKTRQIHNTVKTIIDLRIAKETKIINKAKELAIKIVKNKQYENEYERGFEAWRFIILRKKYKTLRNLIEKWFL